MALLLLTIQFRASRFVLAPFSSSSPLFTPKGKHRDNTPYGEYGGWYKACKVNRWGSVIYFLGGTLLDYFFLTFYVCVQSYSEHHPQEPGCSLPPTGQAWGCWNPGRMRSEISQAGLQPFLWINCLVLQAFHFLVFFLIYWLSGLQNLMTFLSPFFCISVDPEQHSKWFTFKW